MGKRCEELEMGKVVGVFHGFRSPFTQEEKENSQVIYKLYQLAKR